MRHFQLRLSILLLFFIGTVSGQVRPNAHPSQFSMVATPASDSVAVNLTIPSDVNLKTLSARLNGKDVSARLTSASCPQTNCQQATLTVADGLHGIKNVFSVMAKRKDGSLVSARTRFVGAWGLAGAVTFTCSGLPVGATCSFTPSQVTLTDGSSASTSLTISDQKHTARLRPSLPLFAIVLLPLPLLRWKKHATAASKSLGAYMVVGVLLSLFLAACGGSSMPPPVAQPISSTVLITATSGEISRSVPLNLTLQ